LIRRLIFKLAFCSSGGRHDWSSGEFTVTWLVQCELIVEAENENEAVEEAKNRLNEGDKVDYFDFHVIEE